MNNNELSDGKYITAPIHGHPDRTRLIEVKNGYVHIEDWSFTQNDFFKVNRCYGKAMPDGFPKLKPEAPMQMGR